MLPFDFEDFLLIMGTFKLIFWGIVVVLNTIKQTNNGQCENLQN
jgi:hypothetical protein